MVETAEFLNYLTILLNSKEYGEAVYHILNGFDSWHSAGDFSVSDHTLLCLCDSKILKSNLRIPLAILSVTKHAEENLKNRLHFLGFCCKNLNIEEITKIKRYF